MTNVFNLLDQNMNSYNGQETGDNPFDRIGSWLGSWQDPIATFGLVVAAIIGVGLLVTMMVCGEQMRARIKKHLVVIIGCVVGLLAVSYIISYTKGSSSHFFEQSSVAPWIKFHLSSMFPNLF